MTEGYQDADGKPTMLYRLCRGEPAWAANRVRALTEERDAAIARAEAAEALCILATRYPLTYATKMTKEQREQHDAMRARWEKP